MGTNANSEQLKAIEHFGGVLLKAGAGSGKTFVLKEHLIYRTQKWFEEYKEASHIENFSEFIASQFSKTVLMTFTKKAAGELEIRLRSEFEDKENEGPQWSDALASLDKLTITTIHGFCYKLIKEGHFKNVDSNANIINSAEFYKKMNLLFEQWLSHTKTTNEFLIKDQDRVLAALIQIFSDPMIRRTWSEIDLQNSNLKEESTIELFSLKGLDESLSGSVDLSDENKGKKWYDFLVEFIALGIRDVNAENFLILNNFFKSKGYKIPVSPRGKTVSDEEKIYYSLVKDLNAFLKKDGEDIEQYLSRYQDSVLPWFSIIKSAFDYIDEKYFLISGVTFSDLEYIVYKELKDKDAYTSVSSTYNYLIVDEFQDTSYIQYSIIKSVLGNDLSKLFCVGDVKQAIYGFRGGELGVFLDCEKEVPTVLSLKNNYRSDQNVIHFNNEFFENIFKKSFKFEGLEKHPVEVEYQEVPIAEREMGTVKEIDVVVEGIEKLSNSEIELIEARAILSQIVAEAPTKDVVLYKKLKPSLLLMGLLIQSNIGFTAQVKVPYLEDPILALFLNLIEKDLNENENKDESQLLILTSYLQIMGVKIDKEILQRKILDFEQSISYFGLYQSFYQFVLNLEIANSNYTNNLEYISNICRLYKDDKERLIQILNLKESESYSLDFNFGENFENLSIMSAHASKGLEFHTVYLGGIYTNDKAMVDQSIFGKYPLSFIWRDRLNSKKRFKTPELLLEREINRIKDFSESKRLFYVAATRAERNLRWVRIDFGEAKFRKQSNSWIQGIESWKKDIPSKERLEALKDVKSITCSKEALETTIKKRPLFQIDDMGISLNHKNSNNTDRLMIMPELSVTRLATVFDCPRKFYLKNILKLEISSSNQKDVDFFETTPSDVKSSSSRGTEIHEELSHLILDGFSQDRPSSKYAKDIAWTVDKLKEYIDNYDFISEKSIKFEMFGHMISGIPDLVLNSHDKENFEIWDFKTGRSKQEDDSIYHFQLYCYAYAQYILGHSSKNKPTRLVLCYVDEKKIVDKMVSLSDVENYLLKHWQKTNEPWLTNQESCESCEFNEICK